MTEEGTLYHERVETEGCVYDGPLQTLRLHSEQEDQFKMTNCYYERERKKLSILFSEDQFDISMITKEQSKWICQYSKPSDVSCYHLVDGVLYTGYSNAHVCIWDEV